MSRRRQSGFTLMEILIAMAILMIGLLPMLAVFRTAIANLNRAIEDTYAAAIAQSVADSIRLGLKDMKVEHDSGTLNEVRFFLLEHDGSEHFEEDRAYLKTADISSPAFKGTKLGRDYVVVLPSRDNETENITGSTPRGKAFLYPRKTEGDTRPALQYVNRQTGKQKIEKVYQLGKKMKSKANEQQDDKVFEAQNDAYAQYSFAFTVRRAKGPDPLAPEWDQKKQKLDDVRGLYEVNVMVFRNFSPDPKVRRNDPIREFVTYVAE
jgi:prepilin-type N-terminal cleavage/methylation domain-containing protein